MSYGFTRRPSEAMKSAAEGARGGRRYKLSRLALDEVSLVSRAANPLAKVAFTKRDREDRPMQTETTTFAKALENVRYAKDEDSFAKNNYGNLAKFHKDGPGALVAAVYTRDYLARQAESVAKRDAEMIAMTKADGPMSPEQLVDEATERHAEYHKLGKPKRPLQAFIDDVIAEANGRNPKPVSP
jgi:hypothetical protein